MMTLDKVRDDVLTECADDHVGLWSLVWQVRHELGTSDPDVLRRQVLDLIRQLLASGKVRAGFPAPDGRGFREWSLPPDQLIARIQAEWNALGRTPDIGDIVYFTTIS